MTKCKCGKSEFKDGRCRDCHFRRISRLEEDKHIKEINETLARQREQARKRRENA